MKKILGILVGLCASVICLTGVSAKEINLASSEYDNSYIVGNRVFTLNSYALSAWNVKEATDEYNRFSKALEETPMLYIIGGFIYEVNKDGINWDEPVEIIEIGENGKVEVFGVNGDPVVYPVIPYEEEKVTAKVNDVVDVLNKSAESYGFSEINYDSETHEVTFQIEDGSKSIKDYAKSGIVDFVKAFVSDEFGVESVSMDGMSYEGIKYITESELVAWCAGAIRSTIGEDAEDKLSSLQGKTIEVTVTYADETEITYTIAFN